MVVLAQASNGGKDKWSLIKQTLQWQQQSNSLRWFRGKNLQRKEILKIEPVNGRKAEKAILVCKGQVIIYFD